MPGSFTTVNPTAASTPAWHLSMTPSSNSDCALVQALEVGGRGAGTRNRGRSWRAPLRARNSFTVSLRPASQSFRASQGNRCVAFTLEVGMRRNAQGDDVARFCRYRLRSVSRPPRGDIDPVSSATYCEGGARSWGGFLFLLAFAIKTTSSATLSFPCLLSAFREVLLTPRPMPPSGPIADKRPRNGNFR
jgi:hypothetical protein